MGNFEGFCCNEKVTRKNSLHDSLKVKILTMNQEFILKEIRNSQTKFPQIKIFEEYHNVLNIKYLIDFKKTFFDLIYQGEAFQPQPESNLDFSKQSYKQAKSVLYQFIKDDIIKHPKSLFNIVLRSHLDFICSVYNIPFQQIRQDNETSTEGLSQYQDFSITYSNNKVNFSSFSIKMNSVYQDQEQIANVNRRNLSQLETTSMNQSIEKIHLSKDMCSLTLKQINQIAIILRILFMSSYQDIVNQFFKGFQQSFTERELFLQKVIQHFYLGVNSPLKCLLSLILEVHYENEIIKQNQQDEPKLDVSLMPKQQLPAMIPVEENVFDDDSIWRSSAMSSVVNDAQINYIQKMITKSAEKFEKEKIPYYETFPIIVRLVQTQKPWKKFKLIETLVRKIQMIFLRERSQSQFDQCYEVINAEDSKSEIMLFIIYKFSQAHNYIDLKKMLLYPLRFMSDFDGFLHQDIKYIHCISFIRFYSVLELLIVYYIYN